MGLSSQNLPYKAVWWSMCLTQKELFPVHTMKSHLPTEFSLLPPTCKRNLIGWYSNLYFDKKPKPTKTQTQQNTLCEDLIQYFSFTALYLCWSTISVCSHPLDFQFLPGASKSSQLFSFSKLRFKSPACSPVGCICFHMRLPPLLEFKVLFCLRQGWSAIKTLLPLHKPPVIFFINLPTPLLLPKSCCSPAHHAICTAGIQR